jgi:hypothetical protein
MCGTPKEIHRLPGNIPLFRAFGQRPEERRSAKDGVLWGFPRFTQSDRDLFFTLTAPEREALEQRRSIRTKIHFLLHLGYFRARQRFFRFELPAVRDDVDYLRRRYFDNRAVADLTVSDHTRKRHVEAILGLFRYRLCALDERVMLEAHAREAARISSRPVYVLRELVDLLRRERVVLPGYTILQNTVRGALAFERERLSGALAGLIDAEDARSLDRLLADDEGLHQITTIKRQPRDFRYASKPSSASRNASSSRARPSPAATNGSRGFWPKPPKICSRTLVASALQGTLA